MQTVEYFPLIISSSLIVGICSVLEFDSYLIAVEIGDESLHRKIYNLFWISDATSQLIGGILIAYTVKFRYGYILVLVTWFAAATGFSLIFLARSIGHKIVYLSSLLLGGSSGMMWILAPQMILKDAGENNFNFTWGFSITSNMFWTMIVNLIFFSFSREKQSNKFILLKRLFLIFISKYILSNVLSSCRSNCLIRISSWIYYVKESRKTSACIYSSKLHFSFWFFK